MRNTMPATHHVYRSVLALVVVALAVLAVFAVVGIVPDAWHGVLRWIEVVRQSWTDLDWDLF